MKLNNSQLYEKVLELTALAAAQMKAIDGLRNMLNHEKSERRKLEAELESWKNRRAV